MAGHRNASQAELSPKAELRRNRRRVLSASMVEA
jgi:hypothetical protein